MSSSRERTRNTGLVMIAGAIMLGASTLIESISIRPDQGYYQLRLASGRGFYYDKKGLRIFRKVPCTTVLQDPRRVMGSRYEGPGSATVSINLNNPDHLPQIVDVSSCKYPTI